MSLHQQIMRLTVPYSTDIRYIIGHRDARLAAAELALKADAVIEAACAVLAWRWPAPSGSCLYKTAESCTAIEALAAAVAALE